MTEFKVLQGDCREVLKQYDAETFDAVVTDPPYGLSKQPDMREVLAHWLAGDDYKSTGGGFMGKEWDSFVPGPATWAEVFRVLKPGAHALVFAGSRTHDLMATALRLAGFEIRDTIMWLYGSGFPKSHDVAKAIDKAAGVEREVIGPTKGAGSSNTNSLGIFNDTYDITAAATPAAKQWDGWGTALKPAFEPVIVARKPTPLTVAANVQKYGTGAINIDGCRVPTGGESVTINRWTDGAKPFGGGAGHGYEGSENDAGRWPANIIHDGSDEVTQGMPETGGGKASNRGECSGNIYGGGNGPSGSAGIRGHDDAGGNAARYFYTAKASKLDREEGLEHLQLRTLHRVNAGGLENEPRFAPIERKNIHATVKPTDLMRYLVRLVSPAGSTILDPFAGSGSTGKAAMIEGVNFVGVELDVTHCEIASARIAWAAGLTPEQLHDEPETAQNSGPRQGSLF